jgi:formiminotetrahydrofolate cyclodeaminase
VRINLTQLKDEKFKAALAQRMQNISADSDAQFEKITKIVEKQLSKS